MGFKIWGCAYFKRELYGLRNVIFGEGGGGGVEAESHRNQFRGNIPPPLWGGDVGGVGNRNNSYFQVSGRRGGDPPTSE